MSRIVPPKNAYKKPTRRTTTIYHTNDDMTSSLRTIDMKEEEVSGVVVRTALAKASKSASCRAAPSYNNAARCYRPFTGSPWSHALVDARWSFSAFQRRSRRSRASRALASAGLRRQNRRDSECESMTDRRRSTKRQQIRSCFIARHGHASKFRLSKYSHRHAFKPAHRIKMPLDV